MAIFSSSRVWNLGHSSCVRPPVKKDDIWMWQEANLFILTEQCTWGELKWKRLFWHLAGIKQSNWSRIFFIYPPEQLHNVIYMSACAEHIHYVRDEITSVVRTPVRLDLCGDNSLLDHSIKYKAIFETLLIKEETLAVLDEVSSQIWMVSWSESWVTLYFKMSLLHITCTYYCNNNNICIITCK